MKNPGTLIKQILGLKPDRTVYVLTWCKRAESLWGNLLVFDSIRTGFPDAKIVVYDNASHPSYRKTIKNKVNQIGGTFHAIKKEIKHHEFIRQRIMSAPTDQICFVDPDVLFWQPIPNLPPKALIAGRCIPTFRDPYSKTLTWERLHTSLLMVDAKRLRNLILQLEDTMFEFDAIRPQMICRQGRWERYDTTATLYDYLKTHLPNTIIPFGANMLNRYDHLFCGTHLWDIAEEAPELASRLRAAHTAARTNPRAVKGLWRQQQKYFESLK